MTKGEFLMTLRNRLTGEVPPDVVQRNVAYYEKYISDAAAAGRTEEAILDELGDPLLIAKTIIDTAGIETDWYREQEYDPYRQNAQQSGREKQNAPFRFYSVPSWVGWVFLILILILLVTVVRVLLPIAVPLLILWMLFSMFRRNRR